MSYLLSYRQGRPFELPEHVLHTLAHVLTQTGAHQPSGHGGWPVGSPERCAAAGSPAALHTPALWQHLAFRMVYNGLPQSMRDCCTG